MKELKLFIPVWMFLTVSLDLSLGQGRTSQLRQGRGDDRRGVASRERKASRDSQNKLVVTTILKEPFMMMKPRQIGSMFVGNDLFEGYMADVLRNLSQSIGFEYTINVCLDSTVGESDLNGHWNGMMGEIQAGNADIAVGPITVTPEREEVVDFTDHLMEFRSTAVIKRPRKRRKRNLILNAEDLLQSDVMYGTMDGSITQRLLRTSSEPLWAQMWAQMQNFWPVAFVQSIEEGVERARRENYALIMDTPMAEYIVGQEPCEFYTIEPFLSTRRYAIALRKNDRLREVINTQLRHMYDHQVMTEIYMKWWRSKCDLYLPRADRKTSGATPKPGGRTSKAGKAAQLGSRGSCNHSNHVFVMGAVIMSIMYCPFVFHDIRRYLLV